MIHVIGGTYLELCPERNWHELYGSGLRASVALAQLKTKVNFHTFVGKKVQDLLLAKTTNITVHPTPTERTIGFNYLHTISKPSIEPEKYVRHCAAKPRIIDLTADKLDKVLRFGMLEGTGKVNAKMVTYDPQMPQRPEKFHSNGSRAERLAIVANQREAELMTGRAKPESACKALIESGAEVAVVKCGPNGCLVGTANGVARVPAYFSRRTWPIGSGDIFSALFAQCWMEEGRKPAEAADRASKATSYFVETGAPPTEKELQDRKFKPLKRLPRDKQKEVYLAGPFFSLAQRWLIEEFRSVLIDAGIKVFSPLHDVGRGEAKVVYEPDMKGLRKSGVVLACLDGLDSGTVYEIGYAHSRGTKVIGYVAAERSEDLKMIEGGGSVMTNDFATAVYLTIWAATSE